MRGAADRSSLCHPGFHRQDVVPSIPAVRPSCRATLEASSNYGPFTTSEVAIEFGNQNPFNVPSRGSCDDIGGTILTVVTLVLGIVMTLLSTLDLLGVGI